MTHKEGKKTRQKHTKSPADKSIRAIAEIEENARRTRSYVDQAAGTITRLAGSGPALVVHAIWFAVWIVWNLRLVPRIEPFDPFPFSLLTTIVSLEAIFLTIFVLIAQNRLTKESDKRALLDLQVNLLAERETTMILRMLQEMGRHWGLSGPASKDLRELLQETQVDELAEKLEEAVPSE
jgi:uncharacterized membrane protein